MDEARALRLLETNGLREFSWVGDRLFFVEVAYGSGGLYVMAGRWDRLRYNPGYSRLVRSRRDELVAPPDMHLQVFHYFDDPYFKEAMKQNSGVLWDPDLPGAVDPLSSRKGSPAVARSAPDFPHVCPGCGGEAYIGFSSVECRRACGVMR